MLPWRGLCVCPPAGETVSLRFGPARPSRRTGITPLFPLHLLWSRIDFTLPHLQRVPPGWEGV
jgi:hypothetical protein